MFAFGQLTLGLHEPRDVLRCTIPLVANVDTDGIRRDDFVLMIHHLDMGKMIDRKTSCKRIGHCSQA